MPPVTAFIPATSSRQRRRRPTKSTPLSHERLAPAPGAPGRDPAEQQPDVLAGEVGVLLGARERELLLDDLLGEHEPGVVVARSARCAPACRACRSPGTAAPAAACPVASSHSDDGPGQDPDAVVGPDRVVVGDALGVVPHPVAVDDAGAGGLGDAEHPAVDVRGHAGEHAAAAPGRAAPASSARTRSWLPPMPPEVTITACARELEVADRRRGSCATPRADARWARAPRPRTPVTAPSVTISSSTRCRNAKLDQPGVDAPPGPGARTARRRRGRCPR